MHKASKEAVKFVKALEAHTTSEATYWAIGFELSNFLDKTLAHRLEQVYSGYQRGREIGM